MVIVLIVFLILLMVGLPVGFAIGISGATYFLQHGLEKACARYQEEMESIQKKAGF